MTQPSLLAVAEAPQTLTEKLAAYFKARPNVWIDGMELARIAGQYAWRSRVSNLRKLGMVIENRQRRSYIHTVACAALLPDDVCDCVPRPVIRSEYRYVPESAEERVA